LNARVGSCRAASRARGFESRLTHCLSVT
jgi:hypothetical protein